MEKLAAQNPESKSLKKYLGRGHHAWSYLLAKQKNGHKEEAEKIWDEAMKSEAEVIWNEAMKSEPKK